MVDIICTPTLDWLDEEYFCIIFTSRKYIYWSNFYLLVFQTIPTDHNCDVTFSKVAQLSSNSLSVCSQLDISAGWTGGLAGGDQCRPEG